jgi:hypothetical protein
MSYAEMVLAMVPLAPPTRKNRASDLLTGADLGEHAVLRRVEVDLQGLLVGVELVAHSFESSRNRNSPARNLGLG